jgi:hypothetical protein
LYRLRCRCVFAGQDWERPPFSGAVADGFIWGRGTLDVKIGAVGLLEAATALLHEGATANVYTATYPRRVQAAMHIHVWLQACRMLRATFMPWSIWGRGTLGVKIGAVGLLEAATALLHEGAMATGV